MWASLLRSTLSVSVHLAVQLGDGQGGEGVLRELQIAGAVLIRFMLVTKKVVAISRSQK